MNNPLEKPKLKSQQKINLPHINHSKSLPVVQHPKKEAFNLRFVNEHMPLYDPNKDRYLHHFFQQKNPFKQPLEPSKQRKSLKTLPSQVKQTKTSYKRQKLMTIQSESVHQQQGVRQISKQQFGNFMEMMKQKLQRK